MSALGSFEVNLEPQNDENAPAGRMLISKQYRGDMQGTGIGQMSSKRKQHGAAAYSAIEEFAGSSIRRIKVFTTLRHSWFLECLDVFYEEVLIVFADLTGFSF